MALLLCGIAPGLGSTPTLVAHVAGAVAGAVFALLPSKNFRANNPIKTPKDYHYINVRQQERRGLGSTEQAELDTLLEKVRRDGFKSLSMKQRSRLVELSNKISKN